MFKNKTHKEDPEPMVEDLAIMDTDPEPGTIFVPKRENPAETHASISASHPVAAHMKQEWESGQDRAHRARMATHAASVVDPGKDRC